MVMAVVNDASSSGGKQPELDCLLNVYVEFSCSNCYRGHPQPYQNARGYFHAMLQLPTDDSSYYK